MAILVRRWFNNASNRAHDFIQGMKFAGSISQRWKGIPGNVTPTTLGCRFLSPPSAANNYLYNLEPPMPRLKLASQLSTFVVMVALLICAHEFLIDIVQPNIAADALDGVIGSSSERDRHELIVETLKRDARGHTTIWCAIAFVNAISCVALLLLLRRSTSSEGASNRSGAYAASPNIGRWLG